MIKYEIKNQSKPLTFCNLTKHDHNCVSNAQNYFKSYLAKQKRSVGHYTKFIRLNINTKILTPFVDNNN